MDEESLNHLEAGLEIGQCKSDRDDISARGAYFIRGDSRFGRCALGTAAECVLLCDKGRAQKGMREETAVQPDTEKDHLSQTRYSRTRWSPEGGKSGQVGCRRLSDRDGDRKSRTRASSGSSGRHRVGRAGCCRGYLGSRERVLLRDFTRGWRLLSVREGTRSRFLTKQHRGAAALCSLALSAMSGEKKLDELELDCGPHESVECPSAKKGEGQEE